MKTIHSFRIVTEDSDINQTSEHIYPRADITISDGAGLEDMLYAFERFLEASGYILPENSTLDFVVDEPEATVCKGEFLYE